MLGELEGLRIAFTFEIEAHKKLPRNSSIKTNRAAD